MSPCLLCISVSTAKSFLLRSVVQTKANKIISYKHDPHTCLTCSLHFVSQVARVPCAPGRFRGSGGRSGQEPNPGWSKRTHFAGS